MVLYNFKNIQVIPTATDFVDIVLSNTQRKTPTVVHNTYPISAIRSFYMRKVKHTQQIYHDRLSKIIEQFPVLDNIHPFYADLLNVLYDKDHYKLALGQLNVCKNLIDHLGRDYNRLLKYGDSMYRCKQLKRAALGRMSTLVRKQKASLAYLEEVRQHLARLPSIDPNERTLLVCGYPNVGKSSFLNKVTRADVDVQPYAFTTKSLFVGHTDHKFLRWQVIDTPGILDHPLEERNTIEMQSITALAHLRAAILYLIDISESCGYTITQQIALFNSIKPLFTGKPLFVVLSKVDILKPEALPQKDQEQLQALEQQGVVLLQMSTKNEEGVSHVKQVACDTLLEQRVEAKLRGNRVDTVLASTRVAMPKKRDNKRRPPIVPPSVQKTKAQNKPVLRPMSELKPFENVGDLMLKWDGEGTMPGFKDITWKDKYILKEKEWAFDKVPEIMDGRNVADYIDVDILKKLEQLEEEEERMLLMEEEEAIARAADMDSADELTEAQLQTLGKIRAKKKILRAQKSLKASARESRPVVPRNRGVPSTSAPRTKKAFAEHLESMGVDEEVADGVAERVRSRSRGRKRKRESSEQRSKSRGITVSRSRSKSRAVSVTPGEGFKNVTQKKDAIKQQRKKQYKMQINARAGEGDRRTFAHLDRHLNSGKRGIGKTDYR